MGIDDKTVGADPSPPRAGGSTLAAAESQTPFRGLKIKANTVRFPASHFWLKSLNLHMVTWQFEREG